MPKRSPKQTDIIRQLNLLEESIAIRAKLLQHPLDSQFQRESVRQMRLYIADYQHSQRLIRELAFVTHELEMESAQ